MAKGAMAYSWRVTMARAVWAGVVLGLAVAAWPMAGSAKTADCRIESGGKVVLSGPCEFFADGADGSFGLSHRDKNRNLYPGIISVYLAVMSPGVADVRGLTKDGINSRWGEARRSAKDRACWVGSDFTICAR